MRGEWQGIEAPGSGRVTRQAASPPARRAGDPLAVSAARQAPGQSLPLPPPHCRLLSSPDPGPHLHVQRKRRLSTWHPCMDAGPNASLPRPAAQECGIAHQRTARDVRPGQYNNPDASTRHLRSVPPVAMRSSTSTTRCPGCTAPTCISMRSVLYSVTYSSESVAPASARTTQGQCAMLEGAMRNVGGGRMACTAAEDKHPEQA